ncbi:hypothetical protein Ana3638_08020 [Anaerocolumna sedimenticola]|uniref:DUF4367 domain-containing protein n=1 Tax=Anaerocolumna sedimenticola TaxID=2696063 RepID=A0A6P1TN16_9FIRM|nr:hypothetical protein [Anaerocolumna sedimenticola]QHQ60728.1 hypothetical protein Ana3638_08020 [Anaerocolumna sedimenticola]
MDKNKINNSLPSDLDDLRVKDHLNASFELDNLTVSEDLIARTLKAIKESDQQEEQSKKINKIKHFPVRRLVSAAAAIAVLIVGINIFQNSFTGNKKGTQISMDSSSTEKAPEEAATMENYSAAADGAASLNNSTKSSEITGSSAEESDMAAADEEITTFSAELKEDTKKAGGASSGYGENLFSVLYPINYDTVTTFNVSKNGDTGKALKETGIKVNEFYNILDGYPLTESNTNENRNTAEWIYKAEIVEPNQVAYTIIIGDTIQVEQKSETGEPQVSVYSTENMDNLIKQIQDFYNSNNK